MGRPPAELRVTPIPPKLPVALFTIVWYLEGVKYRVYRSPSFDAMEAMIACVSASDFALAFASILSRAHWQSYPGWRSMACFSRRPAP